jgi:hypothetical protein
MISRPSVKSLFKACLLLCLLLISFSNVFSQTNLKVTLIEKESKNPVCFATIILSVNTNTTVISKTIKLTDSTGEAHFIKPKGKFKLSISHIEYNDTSLMVSTLDESEFLILLTKKPINLMGEVTIIGYRKSIQEVAGGYQYVVDKNAVLISRDVSELLKHLPGINQTRDGSLTLMGDKVTYWVDGKPLNMSPDELNAYFRTFKPEDIKSIKVYTTPPSIFDASTPCVIEIITNKNFINGMQYNLESYAATHDKYYESISIKYANKSYSGNAKIFFDHSNSRYSEVIEQKNDLLPDSLYYYNNQTTIKDNVVNTFSATSNNDFALSKNSYLGINLRYNQYDNFPNVTNSDLSIFNRSGQLTSSQLFNRTNFSYTKIGYGGISYRSILNKKGTALFIDGTIWNRSSNAGFSQLTENFNKNNLFTSYSDIDNNASQNRIQIYTASFSLLHDLNSKTRLRFGGKETFINNNGNYNQMMSNDNITFITDTTNSFDLIYKENVPALFVNVSGEIKKLQYTAGLRWEGTTTNIETTRQLSHTDNINNYSNFLPSISFSYKLSKSLSAGFGFSRSIIRIQYAQLNPLNLRRNSFTSYEGNPYLKAILQNALNFSLNKTLPKNRQLKLSVRYSISTNPFLPFLFADTIPGQYIQKYFNYKDNTSLFANLFYSGNLSKNLSLNASARAFNTWIHLDNIFGYPDPVARWTYGGNIGFIFNFWKNAAMELKGNYQSKQILVQGYGYEVIYASVSFSKSFYKNALSVSLNVNDIFDSNKNTTNSSYPGFSQYTYSKDETRIASLTIGYRFGHERKNNIKSYIIQDEKRFAN